MAKGKQKFLKDVLIALEKLGKPATVHEVREKLVNMGRQFVEGDEAFRKRIRDYLKELADDPDYPVEKREVLQGKRLAFEYEYTGEENYDEPGTHIPGELGVTLLSLIMDDYCQYAVPPRMFYEVQENLLAQLSDSEVAVVKRLKDRFFIEPRGLALRYTNKKFLTKNLDPIYQAIEEGKKLKFTYWKIINGEEQGREHVVSPIGIKFSDPKFYLVIQGKSESYPEMIVQNMTNVEIVEELVGRGLPSLKDINKKRKRAIFGPDINKDTKGKMVPYKGLVKIKIFNNGNIIRDVMTFKLAENQKEIFDNEGNLIIELKKIAVTHQFIEWLLARSCDVEILYPDVLIDELKRRLLVTLSLYKY